MGKAGRISDSAVMAKIGRDWKGWFSLLDGAGAKKMAHKDIARHLAGIGVPPWWS